MTPADAIAEVVADLRATRIVPLNRTREVRELTQDVATICAAGPIVDATALYRDVTRGKRMIDPYGDYPCVSPPWEQGLIAYQNEHGNVMAMGVIAIDYHHPEMQQAEGIGELAGLAMWANQITESPGGRWETSNPVDWDRVRWTIDAYIWVGGADGTGRKVKTVGPLMLWRIAVYETGESADVHWVNFFPKKEPQDWDNCSLVLLSSMNFLNAVNTELREPLRSRPERRRLERLGVRVSTIHVRPTRSSNGKKGTAAHLGACTPLSSVRGHFNHYGDCCPGRHDPKGLAFGKLSGRFWVPQHARGDAEHGQVVSSYKLEP